MSPLDIFNTYGEYFHRSGIIESILYPMGWSIINLLRQLCSFCSALFDAAFKVVDFTKFAPVQAFLVQFKSFFGVGILISLIIMAGIYIVNPQNRPPWFKNLIIGVATIGLLPALITQANSLILDGKEAIIGASSEAMVDKVVSDNIYDLVYMLQNEFYNYPDTYSRNNIQSSELLEYIDILDVINPSDDMVTTDLGKQLISKKMTVDNQGNASIQDIKKKTFLWIDYTDYYYRWHIDFVPVIIELIAIGFLFVMLAYKVVRLIAEIYFGEILALMFSGHITSGSKVVKILTMIFNSYVVLFMTCVFLYTYTLFSQAITAYNFNIWIEAILLLFVAFCFSDGPNIIQQILGIDAGLSSSLGKLFVASKIAGFTRNMLFGNPNRQNSHGLVGAATRGGSRSAGFFRGAFSDPEKHIPKKEDPFDNNNAPGSPSDDKSNGNGDPKSKESQLFQDQHENSDQNHDGTENPFHSESEDQSQVDDSISSETPEEFPSTDSELGTADETYNAGFDTAETELDNNESPNLEEGSFTSGDNLREDQHNTFPDNETSANTDSGHFSEEAFNNGKQPSFGKKSAANAFDMPQNDDELHNLKNQYREEWHSIFDEYRAKSLENEKTRNDYVRNYRQGLNQGKTARRVIKKIFRR